MKGLKKNKQRQNLYSMIEEAEQLKNFQESIVQADIDSHGLDFKKLRQMVIYHIDRDDLDSFRDLLGKNDDVVRKIYNHHLTDVNCTDQITEVGQMREILLYAIKGIKDLLGTEGELQDIKDEMHQNTKKYVEEVSSKEYEEHRLIRLNDWKDRLKSETDPLIKKELEKNIRIESDRFTLGFLFDRLSSPKTCEEEKKMLLESFFNKEKSSYIMKRFNNKASQAGFDPSIYQLFSNLEEKFLEESYHPFNNFFLQACIRYIAYVDVYKNYMEVQCIITNLNNLLYGRFANDEIRTIFLSSMRRFLNYFEDERERFEQENICYKNHPHRIAKMEEYRRKQRAAIYKHLNEMGVLKEVTEEFENMSLDELIEYSKEQDTIYKKRHALVNEIMILSTHIPDGKDDEVADLDSMSMEELENYKLHIEELFHNEIKGNEKVKPEENLNDFKDINSNESSSCT